MTIYLLEIMGLGLILFFVTMVAVETSRRAAAKDHREVVPFR